jgi:hypothetical protein
MKIRAWMCLVAIPLHAVKKKKNYVIYCDSYYASTGIGYFWGMLDD